MTLVLALALWLSQEPPAPPLRVSTAVAPDTVTVGDRFRVLVRVSPPPGATVEFEPMPVSDTLQQPDSVRVLRDSTGAVTAVYPLVAWVAALTPAAAATVRVMLADGAVVPYRVPLRMPWVRSVLPTDTAGLKPKPARGVLRVPRPAEWHRLLLLALAVLAALALAFWLYRRRARRPALSRDPRELALERLDALRGVADPEQLYTGVTRVLRELLAATDPRWAEHRTTTELVQELSRSAHPTYPVAELALLLREAEPVKFGGARPEPGETERFWSAARAWVERLGATSPDDDREAA